jgi:hypothetical protein
MWAFAQESDKPAATAQDPQAAYQALVKGLQKAVQDWRTEAMKQVQEAQKEGKPMPAIAMQPPTGEFIAKAQELASEYAGTDDAIPFLTFICKSASTERNAVKKAVKTLAMDHAGSKRIGEALPFLEMAAMRFGAMDDVKMLLDEVVDNNENADSKAQALIARGTLRLNTAQTDEDRAAAAADLRKVAEVTKDEDIVAQAKDALFEIEHLQVGCTAPDIVAKDTDGVEFKLSDYRGKVILLDFWGFW